METARTIASVGTLIGDPTRSIILASLLDGAAWTAGELAETAGVTPQTISSHVAMLVDAGMLHRDYQGRHRYYRLASPDIANMLESLTVMSTWHGNRKERKVRVPSDLRQGRTCYDHIAGQLGVRISEAMIERGILNYGDTDYEVTKKGFNFFNDINIDCDELRSRKRKFAHQCLDWSERKYHIAGALGAEIYDFLHHRHWIRKARQGRGIILTPDGARGLRDMLGIQLA